MQHARKNKILCKPLNVGFKNYVNIYLITIKITLPQAIKHGVEGSFASFKSLLHVVV